MTPDHLIAVTLTVWFVAFVLRIEAARARRAYLDYAAKWSDIIGHLEIERFAADKGSKDSQRKTRTSQTTGIRQLIVQDTGSHMAGNRYGMASPIELPEANPYSAVRAALLEAIKPETKKEDA